MNSNSFVVIDEIGRIKIILDIRKKLNIKCGDKFSINVIDNRIILKISNEIEAAKTVVMDEFGNILIPKELRMAMNIKVNDKLNIVLEDNTIVLSKENN